MSQAAGDYNPQQVQSGWVRPATAGVSSLMNANLVPYQNQFRQQVTNRTLTGLERQRQMATNDIGADATAAGAFGGSRHGIAEAETNRGFASAGADALANLNSQGYENAVQGAQYDIGNRMATGQFNANSQNQGRQFNANQNLQSQFANQNAGLNANGQQLQAGGQLGSLANLGFGMGQQINGQQQQQGQQQQSLQQMLMNAGRGQFNGFTGSPNASLQSLLAGIGGANMGQGATTQSNRPGLLQLLSLGLGM